jgi:hypothetical protein
MSNVTKIIILLLICIFPCTLLPLMLCLIGMNNPDGLEDAEFYLANAAEDDALEAELEDL